MCICIFKEAFSFLFPEMPKSAIFNPEGGSAN
jgi:hypothetical protein